MGSYAHLEVAGYPLAWTKNYLDEWIFKPTDRKIFERRVSERSKLVWNIDVDDELETAYEYQASVKVMKRRLDLLGYDMRTVQREFEEVCAHRLESLLDIQEEGCESDEDIEEIVQIYKDADLRQWLSAIRSIIKRKIIIRPFTQNNEELETTRLERELLGPQLYGPSYQIDFPEFELSFPCTSHDAFMRAALEAMDDDDLCTIDATELVNGGWISEFDELIDLGQENTVFLDVFRQSLEEIESLSNLSPDNAVLSRMLFANAITALEAYLADTAKRFILSRPALLRAYVESDKDFQGKNIKISQVFDFVDDSKRRVSEKLDRVSYHNLATVSAIYRGVFRVEIPDSLLQSLAPLIEVRHDIIHRNGRDLKGNVHEVSIQDIRDVIEKTSLLVETIDSSLREGMLEVEEHPMGGD